MVTTHTEREYTLADLETFPDDGVKRELWNGRLVEDRNMPKIAHGALQVEIAGVLREFVKANAMGIVVTEVDLYVGGQEANVLRPDVMYVNIDQIPTVLQNAYATAADLVVEVVSDSDREGDLSDKIDIYLSIGVRSVWVVYPKARSIHLFKPDVLPKAYDSDSILEDQEILPGFQVAVKDIFSILDLKKRSSTT